MTKIHPTRTVKREMHARILDQGQREIIVGLEWPNLLVFRAKGRRQRFTLTAEWCYMQAAKMEALRIKAERAEARKRKGTK